MFLTQKSVTFNEKVAELRLITRPLIIGNKTSAVTLINIAYSYLIAIERNLLLENNYDFFQDIINIMPNVILFN